MLGRAGRGGNLSYEARIYTVSTTNNLINMIKSYTNGTLNEENKDEIRNIGRAFDIIWNDTSNQRTDTHQKQIIKKTPKQKKNLGTFGGFGRR